MRFLFEERAALERFMPGLDERLAEVPLATLEARESPAIELFRNSGGPGLLVPEQHGGLGASPAEAARVQRAIATRSPSLAVATTMHHFSVASLVEMDRMGSGFEWILLEALATERQLLASGFAEGVRGQDVFRPTMRARRVGDDLLVSGRKKPCSLARSMDLLTASVQVENGDRDEFAVAIVAADAPGIHVEPFWRSPVLAGAQSEAVILEDVPVDPNLVVAVDAGDGDRLDDVQSAGFVWFELLMSASYVGMASALVERVLADGRGDAVGRMEAAGELETTMAALEGVAVRMEGGERPRELLTRALLVRYGAQAAIDRCVASAVEQLGGMAFIGGEDVSYYASASRALAFHPPSRLRTAAAVVTALEGQELVIA